MPSTLINNDGEAKWSKLPLVTDVLQDPAFLTATWTLTPTRNGRLPVAEGRGGPFKIAWEIHGHGPIKVVFIMGLGTIKESWQRQTLHLGHEREDAYSVLIVDNRGIGESDVPLMRYSTSEMARDVLEVLEHIGWVKRELPLEGMASTSRATAERQATKANDRTLHIFGISMGGMIAQELACLIPSQLSSLSLLSTAANIENTTTYWENLVNRAGLLIPKSLEASIRGSMRNMYTIGVLAAKDDARLPDEKTMTKIGRPGESKFNTREGQEERKEEKIPREYMHFPTNYHRLVAQELHKRLDKARFPSTGFLLQLIAAGWHHKSPEQLGEMADRIGRERIMVLHGTADNMISIPHGRKLVEYIKPGSVKILDGMGHVAPVERWRWWNELMEEVIRDGERRDGR